MIPSIISVPSCPQELLLLVKSSSHISYTANSSCQLTDNVSVCKWIKASICILIPSTSKLIIRQYLLLALSSEETPQKASHHGGFTHLAIHPSILRTFSPHFQHKYIPHWVLPICSCANIVFQLNLSAAPWSSSSPGRCPMPVGCAAQRCVSGPVQPKSCKALGPSPAKY